MSRKLRRRLRIIAARAMLCAAAIAAVGFTGYRNVSQDADAPQAQAATFQR